MTIHPDDFDKVMRVCDETLVQAFDAETGRLRLEEIADRQRAALDKMGLLQRLDGAEQLAELSERLAKETVETLKRRRGRTVEGFREKFAAYTKAMKEEGANG